jgi:hypothetical protein
MNVEDHLQIFPRFFEAHACQPFLLGGCKTEVFDNEPCYVLVGTYFFGDGYEYLGGLVMVDDVTVEAEAWGVVAQCIAGNEYPYTFEIYKEPKYALNEAFVLFGVEVAGGKGKHLEPCQQNRLVIFVYNCVSKSYIGQRESQ